VTNEKACGRIALVTGASRLRGIGAAVCRGLAAAGTDIFFTTWTEYDRSVHRDVNEEDPITLQKEIEQMGVRCRRLEIDLSHPEAAFRLMNEVENQLGTPSILVNNACHSERDGLENIGASSLDSHYAINVRATTLLSVEFARRFSAKRGGRIINLTSGQSLGPMTDELSYAITKGAVETLTYTLAAAVADKGITVNAVNPGPTDTGWMTDAFKRELVQRFPQGRVGLPEDAARLVVFLASDEAEWITGQIIHSEGGFRR
jgi:3-oxoacyl-[acyl-carrier protein] reductase